MGNYWSTQRPIREFLTDISNQLDKYNTNSNKGAKTEWILNCYPVLVLDTIIKTLETDQCFDLDQNKSSTLPFNQAVILGIQTKVPDLAIKLQRCLEPLMEYLLKLKTKYDSLLQSPDFNLKYLKIDTLRLVNKTNGCICDPDLKLLTDSAKYMLVLKLCKLFILTNTSSFGIRSNIAKNVRELVWQTSSEMCFACHSKITPTDWHCGHVLAVKNGGLTNLANLKALCKKCNTSMGDQHMYEYICANQLPGFAAVAPEEQQLWLAVVTLTRFGELRQPGLGNLPVSKRLSELAKYF